MDIILKNALEKIAKLEREVDRLKRLEKTTAGGTGLVYLWVPCLGGNEGGDITTRRTYLDDNTNQGVNVNSSGDQVGGSISLPNGVNESIEVYPIMGATGACALDFYYSATVLTYLGNDSATGYVNPSSYALSSGRNWLTDQSVTLAGVGDLAGGLLMCYLQAESTPTNAKKVFVYGWVVLLGA